MLAVVIFTKSFIVKYDLPKRISTKRQNHLIKIVQRKMIGKNHMNITEITIKGWENAIFIIKFI